MSELNVGDRVRPMPHLEHPDRTIGTIIYIAAHHRVCVVRWDGGPIAGDVRYINELELAEQHPNSRNTWSQP
jgi:hypothetical protein